MPQGQTIEMTVRFGFTLRGLLPVNCQFTFRLLSIDPADMYTLSEVGLS